MAVALPQYDVVARKAHQATMVGLVALGFLAGEPAGAVPLLLAGAIMVGGRLWPALDLVRQFIWRVLQPAGLLPRRMVAEDRATRRVARLLGGLAWLAAGMLLLAGAPLLAWLLAGVIALMVALDAAFDFCALCFVTYRLDRLGWLPAAWPSRTTPCPDER